MKHLCKFVMAILLLPGIGVCAADAPKPARPLLFADYYIWYHSPANPKTPWLHWTYAAAQTNAVAIMAKRAGEPILNSTVRPLAGFYDSADYTVADWHVQLAKAAGIDAFLVSWWGGDRELDKNFENGILAAAVKRGFKVALLDELAQFHRHATREDQQQFAIGLAGTLRKYKDSPAYLRIEGKPVVYLYQVASHPGLQANEFPLLRKIVEAEVGPVYWIVDKIAHDAKAERAKQEDRVKCIPADWLTTTGIDCFGFYSTFSHLRADKYEELIGKYRYMTQLAHSAGKKMLLPAHPGHDNSHFTATPYVMPRRDGQTFRDYLRAATDAGADYVMVTSWNEWPESTVIEPSSSWADPYLYLKILAEWRGIAFSPPPLPTRTK
jgi:Glycosyltransferase WbsX